jgi:hypothetical protein
MATSSSGMVLLFEDDQNNGARIATAIKKALGTKLTFLRFDDRSDRKGKGTYEDDLYQQLSAVKYRSLCLIVSDRDLSKSQRYPGLSEAVVSKVAARLGVAVCVYAAGQEDTVLERQKSGGDGRIILDSADTAVMAKRVAALAEGFRFIRLKMRSVALSTATKGPGTLLAKTLGRPDVADHLSLYMTGDQRMIVELMPSKATRRGKRNDPRLPTALGSWLYDSVLRFPGLLVDGVSAASYLNIDVDSFRQPDVRRLFSAALYRGPFADSSDPRWWRDRIDDLLQKNGASDGRVLARQRLGRTLKPCQCSVDPSLRAGFYCVISRQPVSREKSQGNISWLPRGADLSRVREDLFAELEPWIGLR